MKIIAATFLSFIVTFAIASAQISDDEESRFNQGSEAFNQQEFEKAAEHFMAVARMGKDLAPLAQLSFVKCQRRLGNIDSARKILLRLDSMPAAASIRSLIAVEKRNLSNASLDAAMRKYEAGKLDEALADFESATETQGGEYILLMKALTHWKLQQREQARSAFRRLLSSTNPDLREHARFFLEQVESRVGPGWGWLFLDVGAGYNTNAFLDGVTEFPVDSPMSQVLVGAGIHLISNRPYFARLGYNFLYEEFLLASGARFFAHDLKLHLGYQNTRWLLRFSPGAAYQQLQASPYLLKTTGGALVQYNGIDFSAGLRADGGYDFSLSSDYDYLAGVILSAKAFADYRAKDFDFGVFYTVSRHATGDLQDGGILIPQNSFGHGPGVRLNWYVSPTWHWEGSLSWLMRSYPTPVQPGGFARSDNLFSGSLKTVYHMAPALQFFVSANGMINRSTLDDFSVDDKNFFLLVSLVGISWDVFN